MSTIAPNDANILYSPYTWHVNGTRARSHGAGAYLRVELASAPTDLVATFDLTNVTSLTQVIAYRVNGGPWTRRRVAASVPLALPADTVWPKTTVEIMFDQYGEAALRWAGEANALKFTGLSSASTIATVAIQKKPLRMLAVGDSISHGSGALGPTIGQSADPPYVAGTVSMGWALPLADLLGAEVGLRGFGGAKITDFGSNGVPKFGAIWDFLYDGQAASFTEAPNVIVTMPGTNDDGAAAGLVQSEMTAWLNDMLTTLPDVPIVVFRNLINTKASEIQAACATCSDPSRVTYVSTAGWWSATDSSDSVHPYGYALTHDIAPRMAANARAALDARLATASGELIYNGAAWVPVGS